jgi:hypothetical protein
MLGFLSKTEYNDGKRGGSYFVYELSVDTDAVFEAREQIERERE